MLSRSAITLLLLSFFVMPKAVLSQVCVERGQTPATAFPVCGTSTFHQATVPVCSTNDLFVPGCSNTPGGALYQNKNPFWYKFTCFQAGTLNFTITPAGANEDYDWQLYDITGHDPNNVFIDNLLVVTGNWAGTFGETGASGSGVNFIQCGSDPAQNRPTFALSPTLIQGHIYILMISHFSDTQSGYDLSFNGGTAVITDPTLPHLGSAVAGCDGTTITVKVNKAMRCNSLTPTGSEFTITPGTHTITSVTGNNCSTGFDFNELTITLQNPLPNGNYQITIKDGTDINTLMDYCDRPIPVGELANFSYTIPQPIFADSIKQPGCSPNEVLVYFPKKINCNTIAANGSDFAISGPSPVTIASAGGLNCTNGKSDIIFITFAQPIVVGGTYRVDLKAGTDGTTVIDECGLEAPIHSRFFTTVDTVSAEFTWTMSMGCEINILDFSHDGAHNVTNWSWTFNDGPPVTTQTHSIGFPSSSTNIVSLTVNNSRCTDTDTKTIKLDNEVNAKFFIPDIICPEDLLKPKNESTGLIDAWQWTFDAIGSSNQKDPNPVQFPMPNVDKFYTVQLIAYNHAIGCSDTAKKVLHVLNNCYIAVPTAFTPNGDGLNDYLYPNNAYKADKLRFSVFNRWGQLIFTTNNWLQKWDGKIKGILQQPDMFVWYLEYTHRDTGQKVFQKGTTMLIR
jgi:gliding motility-associated-like protein